MAIQTMYIGSFGPFQFDDLDLFQDGSPHRMHLTRTPLLGDDVVRLTDIGGVIGSVIQIVPTATIADPVELNALTGSGNGALAIVAETAGAALDPMTLYAWDSNPGVAPENPPYTVDGAAGSMWTALSGLYINQNINLAGNIIMQALATVDGVDISVHAANVDAHHAQVHTIVSHDTSATGAQLDTLTDDSMADALHRHSELSASDGTPDPALSVDATGDVGIGTTSPSSALHIKAGVSGLFGQIVIQNPANDVTSNVAITAYESDGGGNPDQQLWYLGSSTAANENIIFLNRRNAILALGTNNITRMTILGNGNVGIVTTSPNAGLDNLGTTRLGDSTTNYTAASATGDLSFVGSATIWNDIYFPMSSGRIGGANQPTWAAFQGNIEEYTFGINDYIHLPSGEILHSYKEGSDIHLHCHIVTNGSDVADTQVNYEIEYTIGDIGEVMSAAAIITSGNFTIPGGTADRTHLYVAIDDIAGATFLIQAAIKMRFRRIVRVGGTADPTLDPFVLMAGIHIEEDTVGSRTETAK